jgi:hypothetical protein
VRRRGRRWRRAWSGWWRVGRRWTRRQVSSGWGSDAGVTVLPRGPLQAGDRQAVQQGCQVGPQHHS